MGNCCSATPTSDGPVFGVTKREYESAPHPQQQAPPPDPHRRQNSQHSVTGDGGGGDGGGGGMGAGNMTPDSLSTPAEPQQLEHMADREGNTKLFF